MPFTLSSRRETSERGGIVTKLVVLVVVFAVAAFAVYWFVIRSDAAAKPKITETPVVEGGAVDGTWDVSQGVGEGSFVQYRVHEKFVDGLVDNEATGTSTDVTGTMKIAGTEVSDIEVTANLAALKSDSGFRDGALKSRGLETDKFPSASFVATNSITLPSAPVKGENITVSVTGDLTLHGVTKEVTIGLEGRWDGETIQVIGELPILFSDYGITAPTAQIVASVDDNGFMELQLVFTKAG